MEGGLAPPPHSLSSAPPLDGGREVTNHHPLCAGPLGMQGGLIQTAQTLPESQAQIARPGPRWPVCRSDQPLLPLGPPDQEPLASSSRPIRGGARASEGEAGGAKAMPQPRLLRELCSQTPCRPPGDLKGGRSGY